MSIEKLREPFEQTDIGLLPKQLSKDDKNRQACKPGSSVSADGKYCGGYHTRAIHLDYVGHAALTKRLLEADPEWAWEPLGFDDKGLPALDGNGGLWIRLTVCGVSRLGYGDAQGKSGGNAVKEAIGDALRNAGMRFGAALDLWHKGDLSEFSDAQGTADAPAEEKPQPPEGWQDFLAGIASVQGLQEYYDETAHEWFTPEVQAAFTARKLELS